ncbi:MAG: PilZ domain-containing protein [Candidatus Hydrogenedentes bacterium]|nr:PilZ domain-containing protein [Candidatus Hydrogenedentota bacterium]
MSNDLGRTVALDQRRFTRVPHRGDVSYRYAANDAATAVCVDVSHGGVCLAMGRYLRPGRFVLLAFTTAADSDSTVELKAQIVWCRPTDEPHVFQAGVNIFHDEPDVSVIMSELLYQALVNGGHIEAGKGRHQRTGWSVNGQPSASPFMNQPGADCATGGLPGRGVSAPMAGRSVSKFEKAVV